MNQKLRYRAVTVKERYRTGMLVLSLFAFPALIGLDASPATNQSLRDQNEILFQQLKQDRGLSDEQIAAIRKIFEKSGYIGQGNPAVTRHPVTPEQCQARLKKENVQYDNPRFEKICGGKTWRLFTTRPHNNPKTRKSASINSNFPTSHAPTPSSG